jgi:hypothetical protein
MLNAEQNAARCSRLLFIIQHSSFIISYLGFFVPFPSADCAFPTAF